ncbi:metal-binding protein [Rhizobium sp. Root708]|uniref:CYTH and CHAD domain-containing protein n=1 Tax=Rhizobium sp. Root708 TaxID=1736592 RepID=UPI0006FF6A39|nr:CHAD domain-containing protein [Rhizobium sp. Root708]KRB61533.1 metal-binding protein [Rhizobium sp. Root708]
MSSETEIKLDLSQEALDTLMGSDLFGDPDKVLDQRSTYFDTADRMLWKEGYTVRIRQVGGTRTQTVKATGPSRSLFARSEWETPLEGDEPVLDHTSPLTGEFGGDLKLEPVFDVVITRRLWNVVENGSRIEVVLDEGAAISGDRRSPIREAEIELKEGSPSDLFVFARKMDAVANFRFGVRSKAERGFVLADAQKKVVKAEPVHLEQSMNAAAAFKAIALSCVRQFRLNEDILRQHRNPEALHQTRVALRRFRSALSLFKAVLPGDEPQRLNQELRWLAAVLGEARNVDVLFAKASDTDLISKLKTARAATYRDAIEALDSSRTRALMLDLVNWLECGDHLPGNGSVSADIPSGQDFAVRVLEKQRKRLKKDGSALAKADDEHRHEVRKDAKKFRYASEFFASLFDDKRGARRHKKFLAAMEALQDELGALNDLATGPEVLEKHGLADHPAKDTVVSHRDKSALLGKAQAAVDEVLDIKRFWR